MSCGKFNLRSILLKKKKKTKWKRKHRVGLSTKERTFGETKWTILIEKKYKMCLAKDESTWVGFLSIYIIYGIEQWHAMQYKVGDNDVRPKLHTHPCAWLWSGQQQQHGQLINVPKFNAKMATSTHIEMTQQQYLINITSIHNFIYCICTC